MKCDMAHVTKVGYIVNVVVRHSCLTFDLICSQKCHFSAQFIAIFDICQRSFTEQKTEVRSVPRRSPARWKTDQFVRDQRGYYLSGKHEPTQGGRAQGKSAGAGCTQRFVICICFDCGCNLISSCGSHEGGQSGGRANHRGLSR